MKNPNLPFTAAKISAVAFVIGLLCLYAAISKGITALIIVAACVAGAALTALIVSAVFAFKPDKKLKAAWADYLQLAADERANDNSMQGFDYADGLENIRQNYAADPSPRKNEIIRPPYGGKPDYRALKRGNIYYGCLVEANGKLFEPAKYADEALPAVFIYSEDEYYAAHPDELVPLAGQVENDKRHNFLNDEKRYFYNLRLPEDMTDGKTVYATTVWVYRRHIPLGRLFGNDIVPLIAAPDCSDWVFVTDVKFWTKELIVKYINNQ